MAKIPPNFEVISDEMAAVLREKTPLERLQMTLRMWDSARRMILANLRREHPEWTEDEILRETARRMAAGGNS